MQTHLMCQQVEGWLFEIHSNLNPTVFCLYLVETFVRYKSKCRCVLTACISCFGFHQIITKLIKVFFNLRSFQSHHMHPQLR